MNHTSQSLAKYIQQNVKFKGGTGILVGVIFDNAIVCIDPPNGTCIERSAKEFIPILKDYSNLITPMIFQEKKIIPI